MKLIKISLLLTVVHGLGFSCTKKDNNVTTVPISAFTVVNAVVGAKPFITDVTGADSVSAFYSTAPRINYGSFREFSITSGAKPIVIYQITDTIRPMFKNIVNLEPNAMYTLFLSASDANQKSIDTLLIQDNLPYHSTTDSVVGVRFVNLSPGSNPISVNIQGNANGSEVSSLPYRSITKFMTHPATRNISKYVFEIKDAGSGTLLTTFTYNMAPFQNVTVVVKGIYGGVGSSSVGAFLVNNF